MKSTLNKKKSHGYIYPFQGNNPIYMNTKAKNLISAQKVNYHKKYSFANIQRTERSNSNNFAMPNQNMYNTAKNPPKPKGPLLFKSTGYDTELRNNKKIHYFNNNGENYQPKAALNHTSVFLNKSGKFEDLLLYDEVPDENVDESSLSRVSDKIVGRGSITNKLNKFFDSPFQSSNKNDKNIQIKSFYKTNANFISVNLESPLQNPFRNFQRGVASSGYAPPNGLGNKKKKGVSFIQRSYQNIDSNCVFTDRISNKFIKIINECYQKKKKNIIKVNLIIFTLFLGIQISCKSV